MTVGRGNLDFSMSDWLELLKQVNDAREDISQIGYDLDSLNQLVSGLVSALWFRAVMCHGFSLRFF